MPSQQQGMFHHPHLPNTAAAAAGIIRPVPQHAQPQPNNRVRHDGYVSLVFDVLIYTVV